MAEKIAYQDPTAGIMEYLNQLGGSKTTATTSGDISGLQQVLNQQLQGITPEGASKLLEAIFMEGAKQVPGLATTYAQAAGARTSNNSSLQLALQDLQVQLAREGARQLSTNQANAANTAAQLAAATRKTQTVQQPKSRAMQLLPFALANAGKLKKVLPSLESAGKGVFDSLGTIFRIRSCWLRCQRS